MKVVPATLVQLGADDECQRGADSAACPADLGPLLAALDENLSCRGLVDNLELGVDATGALLHQLPAAITIAQYLDRPDTDRRPGSAALARRIDDLFAHWVAEMADRGPIDLLRVPDSVRDILDRVAGALAVGSDHTVDEIALHRLLDRIGDQRLLDPGRSARRPIAPAWRASVAAPRS